MPRFHEIHARYGVVTAYVYGNVSLPGGQGVVDLDDLRGCAVLSVLEDLRACTDQDTFRAVVTACVMREVSGEHSEIAAAFDRLCALHATKSPRRVVYAGHHELPLVSGEARSLSPAATHALSRIRSLISF